MVMAPGGENPRIDHDPNKRSIGIRVRRADGATRELEALRAQFYPHETTKVLGFRRPSTRMKNAFGARQFQPHITVLRPGSSVGQELTRVGEKLRKTIDEIIFDRLVVRCRKAI